MTIYEKLSKIQQRFKSKKSRFNSFGKYYFRSAEDILEAIKPFEKELGFTVTINEKFIDNAILPMLETTATLHDDKGMTISATAIVGVDLDQKGMQMPQRFGAASSYGKKYALGNLFLIDDTQDSDATNDHGKKRFEPKKPNITLDQLSKAVDYVKAGGKVEAITKKYNISDKQLSELKTL